MMYTGLMAEAMVRFFVRLPKPLHSRLADRARRDNRSLNNLVVTLLMRALDEGW